MIQKPQLVPPRVPWEVAPSTPFLRVCVGEGEAAVVRFAGHFRLEHPTDESSNSGGFESIQVVTPGDFSTAKPATRAAPYKVVKVTFNGVGWVRFYPAHSDRE